MQVLFDQQAELGYEYKLLLMSHNLSPLLFFVYHDFNRIKSMMKMI